MSGAAVEEVALAASATLEWTAAPLWLVLVLCPVALVAAWRLGCLSVGTGEAALVRGARLAIALLLVLMIGAPACRHERQIEVAPLLLVLLDDGPTMGAVEADDDSARLLAEALALGLIDTDLRDRSPRMAAVALERTLAGVRSAAESLLRADDPGDLRQHLARRLATDAEALQEAAAALGGEVAERLGDGAERVRIASVQLPQRGAAALDEVLAWSAELGELRRLLARRQRAADTALANAVAPDSAVAAAMRQIATSTRFLRGQQLIGQLDTHLSTEFAGRVRLRALRSGSPPIPLADDAVAPSQVGRGNLADSLLALGTGEPADLVLLISDGRVGAGTDPLPAAHALAARGIRMHGVTIGVAEPGDAAVAGLEAPATAQPGERIALRSRYRIRGLPSEGWRLELHRDEELLETLPVVPDGSWQQQRIEVQTGPSGIERYRLRLLGPDPEPVQALQANTVAETAVAVGEEPLRVLLIDAMPRWESRMLAAVLARDPRIRLDARWLLTQAGDGGLLPDGEDLDEIDVLVLGDLRPDELDAGAAQRLERWVSERGGFLVVLCGPRAMPGAWSLGPLAELLPLRAGAGGSSDPQPRRLRPTEVGRLHPALRLADGSGVPAQWAQLAPWRWHVTGVVPRPLTEVLLESDDEHATPVVASLRVGDGRVLQWGGEESWRWREQLGDELHAALWLQLLRWGAGGRLLGDDPGLRLALDRINLAQGETAELRVRTRPGGEAPSIRLEAEDLPPRSVLPRSDDQSGSWLARLVDLEPGRWTVTVALPGTQLLEQRELLVRRRSAVELAETGSDAGLLARLAEATGGIGVDLAEIEAVLTRLPDELRPRQRLEQRRVVLLNGPVGILLIGLLAGGAWWWRRRRGLS